jgi:hypothetical protein
VGLTDGFTTNAGAATDISNVSSYTATGLSVDPVLFRDNAEESVGYGSGTFSDAVGSTATTTYDPSVAAIDASAVDISSVLVGGRELTELWMSCNKTGIFTASYSSVTGLTGTTTTIRSSPRNIISGFVP